MSCAIHHFDPEHHHRRSIRMRGYDYTQAGAYFVTIATQRRACLLGIVMAGRLRLSEYGHIVRNAWHDLPNHYLNVELDEFVVMPNHIHGIIVIVGAIHESPLQDQNHGDGRIDAKQRRQMLLPKIIGRFKMTSAKRINTLRNITGTPVWQRNYYEHVIRNDDSLCRIRNYIADNPACWADDAENPEHGKHSP